MRSVGVTKHCPPIALISALRPLPIGPGLLSTMHTFQPADLPP